MTQKQLANCIAKMKKFCVPHKQNLRFSQLTTLRCGGKIMLTVFPTTAKQLVRVAKYLVKNKIKHYVLGCGSNVLASDDDFCGVVVCTKQVVGVKAKGNKVTALCGTPSAKLGWIFQQMGLAGGEFLCCLPATVGGVVCCNAGCFGQQASQIVSSVRVFKGGRVFSVSAQKCRFGRRTSRFDGNYVVLAATFCLTKQKPSAVLATVQRFKQAKSATQPLGEHSAGSVLFHPTVAVSALVDSLGLKGYTVGGAQISQKHAGFVINVDKAQSKDIYLLIQYIKSQVWQHFGILPKLEVKLVNFSPKDEL